jgi:hypothetical protein
VYANSLLAALNMRPFFAGQHRDNSRSEPEAFVLTPRSGSFPGSPGVRAIEFTRVAQAHRLPRCLCGSINTLRPRLIRRAPSRGHRDVACRVFEVMHSCAWAPDVKCHVAYLFIRCKYCWDMRGDLRRGDMVYIYRHRPDLFAGGGSGVTEPCIPLF